VGAIARLASGEVVGEMSFVDNTPPSATVRTGAGAKLLAVDKRDLAERMQADPPFAARFYRALAMFLSDRLRAANRGAADDDSDLLDENLLGEVANAGQRFDMMLKQLLGAKR
jgi:CRP/FNR family cyclic AMP-dependent transcriptional regulator